MAPYARPTGAPSMGGIFNNFNSSNINSIPINSTHPYPITGSFNGLWARDAPKKHNDGGAHGALIFAIAAPIIFILFGIIAVLSQSIKTARAAKARRAERRATRRAARKARSSHTTRTSRTSRSTRSNGIFEDAPVFDEVPLQGLSPAYMGSPRRNSGTNGNPEADLPLESPRSALHNSQYFARQSQQ